MSSFKNYYQILRIQNSASMTEIKQAYRKRVREAHPDVGGSESEFIIVKEAYESLSDPLKRRLYDEQYLKLYPIKNEKSSTQRHGNSMSTPSPTTPPTEMSAAPMEMKAKKRFVWVDGVKYAGVALVLFGVLNLISAFYKAHTTNAVSAESPFVATSPSTQQSTPEASISSPTPSSTPTEKPTPSPIVTQSSPSHDDKAAASVVQASPSKRAEPVQNAKSPNGYFTLGSTKNEVMQVMGNAGSISKLISNELWMYGTDSVTFDNTGVVSEFSNISGHLKVWIADKKAGASAFMLGSDKQAVTDIMGTPSSIQKLINNELWMYESSSITFYQNKVISFENLGGRLQVWMANKDPNAPDIGIGSTQQEVLKAMGTPTSVQRLINNSLWMYGFDSITFDLNGTIISYDNMNGHLKIK